MAQTSSSITEALDRIAGRLEPSSTAKTSSSVIEALDRIATRLEPFLSISDLAVGPSERIFVRPDRFR